MFTLRSLTHPTSANWKHTLRVAVLAASVCLSHGAEAVTPSRWAQSGSDAAHTYSNSLETQLSAASFSQLAPLWQRTLGQFYVGETTQTGALVTNCSNLAGASRLNAADGLIRWERPALPMVGCSSIAHDGARLWLTNNPSVGAAQVVALSRSGAVNSVVEVSAPDSSLGLQSPTLWQGQLFASFGRSTVVAFSTQDAQEQWRVETGWLQTPVSVSGGRVFVGTWAQGCCLSADRPLMALDAHNGALLWQQPTGQGDTWFAPLVLGAQVLTANTAGELRAFGAATGQLRWQAQLNGYAAAPLVGVPALGAVVAATPVEIQALRATDGALLWRYTLPTRNALTSNLAHANGVLYFTVMDAKGVHRLAALNMRTGRSLGRVLHSLSGSYAQVSVAGGQVLVASNYGVLQAYAPQP